ncbi:unnamed protein product [Peniophora sp. CBMAI 1063]|nr:unnamed protein product [Peniophora sp. CBMAI 1063]
MLSSHEPRMMSLGGNHYSGRSKDILQILPGEIWDMVIEESASVDPPGCHRVRPSNPQYTAMTLGFIKIGHVCRQLRSRVFNLPRLFARFTICFPNKKATGWLVSLSKGASLTLDFDQTIRASRLRDVTPFIEWLFQQPSILGRAREIKITLCVNEKIITAADYSQDSPFASLYQRIGDYLGLMQLQSLTFPLFKLSDAIPVVPSSALTRAHFIGLEVRPCPGFSRPRYEGYNVRPRHCDESVIYLDNVIDFIGSCPCLSFLRISHISVRGADEGSRIDLKPIHTHADIEITSTDAESIESILAHVVTTGTWDINTHGSAIPYAAFRRLSETRSLYIEHTLLHFTCSYADDSHCNDHHHVDPDSVRTRSRLPYPYDCNVRLAPGVVTVTRPVEKAFLDLSERELRYLTIHGMGSRYSHDGDFDWGQLQHVKRLDTLRLHGERDALNILTNLPCPRHLVVIRSSSIDRNGLCLECSLVEASDRWESQGNAPESTIIIDSRKTGSPKKLPTLLLA